MGTALTGDQVGELSRMAQTVLLALDADSAGQEAMLRASGLAAKRNLELRVVPLPAGADPADLIQREGPEAMTAIVERSVPFVRFRVERVLAGGDDSSPEGQDRMIDELRPVFAQVGPGAMRMELARMVSSRLAVPESVLEQRLATSGGSARAGSTGQPRANGRRQGQAGGERAGNGAARRSGALLHGREDTERAFLALCIAAPDDGEQALASLDIDEYFSSDLLRRAAKHLRAGDLRAPMTASPQEAGAPEDDPELKALLAELVVEGGRESVARPAKLEAQRLQLELARVDRQIQRARGEQSGAVSELAGRRAEVKREFDRAYGRVLEETGDREG
jgi:DNA primase